MDFAWTREQQELRDGILEFARGALNEGIIERDVAGEFNRDGWKRCAEVGIHGLPIPSEYGGLGLDTVTTVGVLERLGYGCKDNGLVFSINAHMWTLSIPILHFGSPEQKKRWLPGLCNGDLIGANGMTEPGSGSDAYSMSTTARRDGNAYVLNGNKIYVSNGSVADVALVYATTDPSKGAGGISAFLVERELPDSVPVAPSRRWGSGLPRWVISSSTTAACRSRIGSGQKEMASRSSRKAKSPASPARRS